MTTRSTRSIPYLMLLAFLGAQPSCTLAGLGAGVGISESERGPYSEHSLPPVTRQEAQAFEQLKLSKGDRVQLLLLDGTKLEGKYLELEAPTSPDAELYLLLVPEPENGHSPSHGREPRHVPLSDVRSVGVKQPDYSWIAGGAALGLLCDVLMVMLLKSTLTKALDD